MIGGGLGIAREKGKQRLADAAHPPRRGREEGRAADVVGDVAHVLNVKAEWVKSFWRIVNWEDVAGRLQAVRVLDLAL